MNTYISILLLFSRSVISNSLWPHGLQHPRLPCPSLSSRACLKSCSLSQWYHPTISSSVIPFSSCLQSFPASGSFPISQFFTSGGQCIGASASASVLPMNIQDWFPFGLTGLISLQSKELLKSILQHHSSKESILQCWAFFMVQLSHPYMAYKADFSSLAAQAVKNLPAKQKTWVQSLGQEDPMEKGIETHPSILAWETPWAEVPGRLQSMGSQRVRHDWATNTLIFSTSWEARIIW